MFFTQEDYRKIYDWIKVHSIKDSEFSDSKPLDGRETITVVQQGYNVKFILQDFLEQLALLNIPDFVNVTERYDLKYISLFEATKAIPYRSRKIGQVITFLDEDGNWKIYQFRGEKGNQWNILTLWVDILEEIIDKGSIIPDEEDLTAVKEGDKTVVKFKDKAYNPDNFSGKGRVYLRKNIAQVQDPTTHTTKTVNLLTQSMIGKEDTIYIIQYDYDLNGHSITIPKGCILQFEGGSFSKGTIVGNNTIINAQLSYILKNIITNGSYKINRSYPEWFGATYSNDDTNAVQKAFDIKAGEVYFSCGNYKISNTITSTYSNMKCNGGATITAISEMDYMFIFDFTDTASSVETLEKYKYCIGNNALLDCNNFAKTAIGIKHCQYFDLNGFKIYDATRYALVSQYYDYNTETSKYKSGNVFFHFLHIINTIIDKNRVALLANRSDSVYGDITPVNFSTFIKIQAGSKFRNIHAWSSLSAIVKDSVLFSIETNAFSTIVECEADTINYFITFTLNATKNSFYGIKQYTNAQIYNDDLYFASYKDTYGHKINITDSQLNINRLIYENNKQTELLNINCIDISGKISNCAQLSPKAYNMADADNDIGGENDLAVVNGFLLYKNNGTWKYAFNGESVNSRYGSISDLPENVSNGYIFIDSINHRLLFKDRQYWRQANGFNGEYNIIGSTTDRPILTENDKGFQYFDTTLNKPIWWDGTTWIDSEGNDVDSTPITSGTFANKPTGVNVGYAYFCTNKQTTEGTTNGIMIYYKGDNVWVDALGKVVS